MSSRGLICRLVQVLQNFRDIPSEAFVAAGLGAWRRGVVGLTEDPGAPVCKAYLEVARRVVASCEAVLDEQSHVAGDVAASATPT